MSRSSEFWAGGPESQVGVWCDTAGVGNLWQFTPLPWTSIFFSVKWGWAWQPLRPLSASQLRELLKAWAFIAT